MTERAVTFGDANLVGVLTPGEAVGRPELPGLLLLNAGLLHRVGPHRLHVTLARRLAQVGVTTLRFDFSGIGDSPPRRDRLPTAQRRLFEAQDAMRLLSDELGIESFVLGGLCRGADDAFRIACADSRVAGAILIDQHAYRTAGFYLRHYVPRLLRGSSWLNLLSGKHPVWKRLLGGASEHREGFDGEESDDDNVSTRQETEFNFRSLIARGANMLVINTAGLLDRYNYRGQFQDAFPSLPVGRRLQIEYLRASDHTCTLLASQKLVVDRVERWVNDCRWRQAPGFVTQEHERLVLATATGR